MSTQLVVFRLLLVDCFEKTRRTVLPARSVHPSLRQLEPTTRYRRHIRTNSAGSPSKVTHLHGLPQLRLFQSNTFCLTDQIGHLAITRQKPPLTPGLEASRLPASMRRLNLI